MPASTEDADPGCLQKGGSQPRGPWAFSVWPTVVPSGRWPGRSHSLSREETGCVAVSSPELVEGPRCGLSCGGPELLPRRSGDSVRAPQPRGPRGGAVRWEFLIGQWGSFSPSCGGGWGGPSLLEAGVGASGSHKQDSGDAPAGPAAQTLRSQCGGPGFDPWSGN